jgi:7-cyano-7-deazaguanine synthase
VTETVVLLSGGIDSAALAYEGPIDHALFIDYGQRPALAESRAARAIAAEVGLVLQVIRADTRAIGGGLLASDEPRANFPSPEWWPFRNQMLVTFAAAWACRSTGALRAPGSVQIAIGSVSGDGDRHTDGTSTFYQALDALVFLQEGNMRVVTPALERSTEELVLSSGITDAVLGWTHSCHTAPVPCNSCPGCFKRERVLANLGRLQ